MIKRFIYEHTPEDLEQRLKLLRHSRVGHKSLFSSLNLSRIPEAIRIPAILILALSFAGTITFLAAQHHPAEVLTTELEQEAGFPLFAPKPLPEGLFYEPATVKASRGTVSYSLKSIHGSIAITEQAAPPSPPDFSSTPLKSSQVPAGTAYFGSSGGRPVAIISSNTTLISVSADATVPADVVTKLSKSLVSLPQ